MFKPIQIADDLKKYGGYIPGVRPGEPTAQFLDFIMTRLTLAGAIFLTDHRGHPGRPATCTCRSAARSRYFFGGTGMLITVGVILDTMRQVETFLLQRHYDGFLKKGRVRARSANPQQAMMGDALAMDAVMKLVWPLLCRIADPGLAIALFGTLSNSSLLRWHMPPSMNPFRLLALTPRRNSSCSVRLILIRKT